MSDTSRSDVAIVGGGPAGLAAAEVLSLAGVRVHLFDAMPSVGRKFLLAGRGGLNLTHAEPTARFMTRFFERSPTLQPMLEAFGAQALRDWAQGLGIDTFVGSSNRVFPTDMKAAPLLRAWLHRLRQQGVVLHARHRWVGWAGEPGHSALRFQTPDGEVQHHAELTLLALGGGSWSRLGSDGAWVQPLQALGLDVAPLESANCGFDVAPTAPDRTGWSPYLVDKFAGQPVKPAVMTVLDPQGQVWRQQGEFVLTATGIEGSLVYALGKPIRDMVRHSGQCTVHIDLLPQHTPEQVLAEVQRPRGPRSLATHLKSRLNLHGLKVALLHELLPRDVLDHDPVQLAAAIKALPITVQRTRPMDEVISTAGGVRFEGLDAHLMSRQVPGLFVAGEMLDWEAPTGGYLLTASMATGRWAAQGMLNRLRSSAS